VSVRSCDCIIHLKHRTTQCIILLSLLLLANAYAKESDEKVILENKADSLYYHAQQLCASYSYDKALEILKLATEIETKIERTNRLVSITTIIGQIYFSISLYDSAITYYNSTLKTARAINDRQTTCSVLNDLGATYEGRCEYEKALAYCDTAISIAREIGDLQKIGQVFCTRGAIYYAMSEYEKARIHCDSALKISQSINDRAGVAAALGIMGAVCDDTGEYDRALNYHRTAFKIDQTINNQIGVATSLRRIARSHYYMSLYDSALVYYLQSLALCRTIEYRRGEGHTLTGIGLVYYNFGQYEDAIAYLDSSLLIGRAINDTRGVGTNLYNIGVVYYALSKFDRALAYYDSSLHFMRKVKSQYTEGAALGSMGTVCRLLGKYEKALAYYDSALIVARKTSDRYGESVILNNIAIVYDDLAQYDKALTYYDTALTIKREIKSRWSEGITLHNMGNSYNALREYNSSLACFYAALAIQREVIDPRGEACTLDDIGVAYYLLGQYERSLAYLDSALQLKRDINDRRAQGITLSNIGRTYHALRMSDKAFAYYDSALAILRDLRIRPHEGTTLDYIGQVYEDNGDAENAIHYYKKAIEVKESIRSELKRADLTTSYIEAEKDVYERLAILLIMLQRYEEAFDYLERSRSEKLRKAFEMGEMVAFDPSLHRTLERINLLTSEMDALRKTFQESKIDESVFEEGINKLHGRLNQAMLDFRIHHPQLYNIMVPQPNILKDVQGAIPDSTLFIAFASAIDRYVALLITKNMFVVETRGEHKDSVNRMISETLTALKSHAQKDELDTQFAHLYDVLLKPLEQHITKYSNIVIVPYGVLHYLPFHALRCQNEQKNRQYFIEWKRVSYLPSANFLTDIFREREPAKHELLAFGNADGTLPNAAIEVDLIAELYPGCHVCKCDSARKDRFIEMSSAYRLIHLATHGVLAADPRFSYIVLAPAHEGNLTVREIVGLSGHFKRTSLVTLSACETAVEANAEAAGMELVTLSNAFKVAGVPTTIASLWEIADRSTALLVENFYRNLKNEGLNKLEALCEAQIKMINHEQYSHPYYWAPFVLIGDWD